MWGEPELLRISDSKILSAIHLLMLKEIFRKSSSVSEEPSQNEEIGRPVFFAFFKYGIALA